MRTIYNYSNYGNDLRLTLSDAQSCSHSGDCENDVKLLISKPYVSKQLKNLAPNQLRKELKEYGAWDTDELNDHNQNLIRWVWISAGDIIERRNEKH